MDEMTMRRIARSCGCSLHLQRRQRHSHKAQNKQACYVYAYRKGVHCSLGSIEVVARMSEDALRTHVATKFTLRAHGGR